MKAANIISTDILHQIIHQSDEPFALLEIGYMNGHEYELGHIPGALFMDSRSFESLPLWNYNDDDQLIELFQRYGLDPDVRVILYDRRPAAAARFGVLLLSFSFRSVHILNGGYGQWLANDYKIIADIPPMPQPLATTYHRISPEIIVDYDSISDIVVHPLKQSPLVSIRSRLEYEGKISGYDYFTAKGVIPHSIDGGDLWMYKLPDGTYIDAKTFSTRFQTLGIHKRTSAILYCGTGWRASDVLFLALAYGYDTCKLYDGGWYEYSTLHPKSF